MARFLIDGNNVMGARPDGWWRDREAAARRLVDALTAWAEATGEEATAVFDGEPPAGGDGRAGAAGPVRVVYAGHRSADDEIVRLAGSDPDPGTVTVVTSDAALAARVRAVGAAVTGGGRFRRLLDRYGGQRERG